MPSPQQELSTGGWQHVFCFLPGASKLWVPHSPTPATKSSCWGPRSARGSQGAQTGIYADPVDPDGQNRESQIANPLKTAKSAAPGRVSLAPDAPRSQALLYPADGGEASAITLCNSQYGSAAHFAARLRVAQGDGRNPGSGGIRIFTLLPQAVAKRSAATRRSFVSSAFASLRAGLRQKG